MAATNPVKTRRPAALSRARDLGAPGPGELQGAPTFGSPGGTRSTLLTLEPETFVDLTQGGDCTAVQFGSGPLVTFRPAESTKGTVEAKQVVFAWLVDVVV